jgi:hypothetical protein
VIRPATYSKHRHLLPNVDKCCVNVVGSLSFPAAAISQPTFEKKKKKYNDHV